MPDAPPGKPQGGMKSEAGRAAYWRMQWESAIGALADLIAEHTETVEGLERVKAEVWDACTDAHHEHAARQGVALAHPPNPYRVIPPGKGERLDTPGKPD